MENNIMRSFSFKAESARANEWNVHTGFSCACEKMDQTVRLAAVQSSGATRQERQLWKDWSRLVRHGHHVDGGLVRWAFHSHPQTFPRLSPDKVPRVLPGPYKYLQIQFAKYGFASPYICITVLTSLANTKNAHG